jgi:hypothetical protein
MGTSFPNSTWQYSYPLAERPAPEVLAVIVITANDLNADGSAKAVDDTGYLNARLQASWWDTDPGLVAAFVEFAQHGLDGILASSENGVRGA